MKMKATYFKTSFEVWRDFYGSNLHILADGLNIYIVGLEAWTLVKQLDWMVGELSRSAVQGRATVLCTHCIYLYIYCIIFVLCYEYPFTLSRVCCNFAFSKWSDAYLWFFVCHPSDLGSKEFPPFFGTRLERIMYFIFPLLSGVQFMFFFAKPQQGILILDVFYLWAFGEYSPKWPSFWGPQELCEFLYLQYLCIGWNCSIIHGGSNQPSQQPVSPCQQPGDHAAAAFLAKRRWESGAGETEARRSYEGRSFEKVVTGRPTPNVPPQKGCILSNWNQWLIHPQVGLISGGYGVGDWLTSH